MQPACCLVGTLNLLGDASNPVEFLPKGGNDEDAACFMQSYQLLERTATSLTSADVKKLSDEVRAAASGMVLKPTLGAPLTCMDQHARSRQRYFTLHIGSTQLTWNEMAQLPREIENGLSALWEHSAQNEDRVWGYFQEDVLRNDNKILDERFNLISFATCPLDNTPVRSLFPSELHQQWHVLRGNASGYYIFNTRRTHARTHARAHTRERARARCSALSN